MASGSAHVVTGTVADTGTVALEQKVLGGWRAVATTSSTTTGEYSLTLPTWWLGSRTYRVRSESAATSEWRAHVIPRYTPRGKDTQFHYSFDSMTRWNPCTDIGYRVNARQATRGALRDTKRAFARMSQATGFRFVYRGRTRGAADHRHQRLVPPRHPGRRRLGQAHPVLPAQRLPEGRRRRRRDGARRIPQRRRQPDQHDQPRHGRHQRRDAPEGRVRQRPHPRRTPCCTRSAMPWASPTQAPTSR